jgi:hypothetical protein
MAVKLAEKTTELELFDELKSDISVFVAPTFKIQVTDGKSASDAVEAAKEIKRYSAQVEKQRKALVGPLNDQVRMINDYAKKIACPLDDAEAHIKGELNAYARKQEEIRQAELRKAEEARREAERKATEERIAREKELQAKLEEERELATNAASVFGVEDPEEFERQQAEAEIRAKAELEAQLERERLSRVVEAGQQQYDANQNQLKNTRKVWKCEVLDLNLVPREFLKIEINTQAVLAAARGGVTQIPGVRLYQDVDVAIGRNTYVPRKLLEE